MDIHSLTDFFKLSAQLNLQLSATAVGRSNIVSVILGRATSPLLDRDALLEALEYLDAAYSERRRRIGPLAVLHPLRAAAILAQVLEAPTTLDVLTAFFHDKLEDITPESIGEARHAELECRFKELLKSIDPIDEWYLMERLDWLTRRETETYYSYIGRLLDNVHRAPSVVAVKLADRLDNTLDMRIALEDPIESLDFFQLLFSILFVNQYRGYKPDTPHPPVAPIRGAQRLYQLFKNAVLLSLVRQRAIDLEQAQAQKLFEALAIASMKEAERTALHIFGYHLTNVQEQRCLVMDVMDYAQAGGTARVTQPTETSVLDGLFKTRFDQTDSKERARTLDELNEDKQLVAQIALVFIVIFQNFLADPSYRVDGVSEAGITPHL
jgi:hypothetical protein